MNRAAGAHCPYAHLEPADVEWQRINGEGDRAGDIHTVDGDPLARGVGLEDEGGIAQVHAEPQHHLGGEWLGGLELEVYAHGVARHEAVVIPVGSRDPGAPDDHATITPPRQAGNGVVGCGGRGCLIRDG